MGLSGSRREQSWRVRAWLFFHFCHEAANLAVELCQVSAHCFGRFGEHPSGLRASCAFSTMHSAASVGHGWVLAGFTGGTTVSPTKGVHGVISHFFAHPPVWSAPITACPPSMTLTRSMVMRCSPVLRSRLKVSKPFWNVSIDRIDKFMRRAM